MKALVKSAPKLDGVGIIDVEPREPGDGEVRIKVEVVSICGTDIHIINDRFATDTPVILGHEYSGYIEKNGKNSRRFEVGQRVVSLTAVSCGNCRYCKSGIPMLCNEKKSIGSGLNGAMTNYLVVPEKLVYKLPEFFSMDQGALCEPLTCAVRAVVERSALKAGDRALISGPGSIGLMILQVAKICGAKVAVCGLERHGQRLELASELGADVTMVNGKDSIREIADKFTSKNGFDVVYECSGVQDSLDLCLDLVRKGGAYSQIALFNQKPIFDFNKAMMKEVNIQTTIGTAPSTWYTMFRLYESGSINLEPLISARLPLSKWKEGYEMIMDKKALKILLYPEE